MSTRPSPSVTRMPSVMLSRMTSSRSISARSSEVSRPCRARSSPRARCSSNSSVGGSRGGVQAPGPPSAMVRTASTKPRRGTRQEDAHGQAAAAAGEDGAEDEQGIGEPVAGAVADRPGVEVAEEEHAHGQDGAAHGQLPVQSHTHAPRLRRQGSAQVPAEPVAHPLEPSPPGPGRRRASRAACGCGCPRCGRIPSTGTPPHHVEQLLAALYAAAPLKEGQEQLELGGGQTQGPAVDEGVVALGIDGQRPGGDAVRRARRLRRRPPGSVSGRPFTRRTSSRGEKGFTT